MEIVAKSGTKVTIRDCHSLNDCSLVITLSHGTRFPFKLIFITFKATSIGCLKLLTKNSRCSVAKFRYIPNAIISLSVLEAAKIYCFSTYNKAYGDFEILAVSELMAIKFLNIKILPSLSVS